MPDVREVGQVSDIDGLTISIGTDCDRVRLEVGRSIVILDIAAAEDFARLFAAACWAAGRQAGGEPSSW